jgi:hypothetical protein
VFGFKRLRSAEEWFSLHRYHLFQVNTHLPELLVSLLVVTAPVTELNLRTGSEPRC